MKNKGKTFIDVKMSSKKSRERELLEERVKKCGLDPNEPEFSNLGRTALRNKVYQLEAMVKAKQSNEVKASNDEVKALKDENKELLEEKTNKILSLNQFRKQFCDEMSRKECIKAFELYRQFGTLPQEEKQEEAKQEEVKQEEKILKVKASNDVKAEEVKDEVKGFNYLEIKEEEEELKKRMRTT
jgi:hypothetical protein